MAKGFPKNGINKGWFKPGQISVRKGVLVTSSTRKKMRDKKLGRKVIFSQKHKDNLRKSAIGKSKPWLKGKRHITPELRLKMVQGRREKWKDRNKLKKCLTPGRRFDSASIEWVKVCRLRDNNKCKIGNQDCCGPLNVHHILPWRDYPELRYDVNNGITLCRFHHPLKYLEEIKLVPVFTNLIRETI